MKWSVVALMVASQACSELPTEGVPEGVFRLTLQVPAELAVGDTAWLRAIVRDREGRRVVEPPLRWRLKDRSMSYSQITVVVLAHVGDSVLVLGAQPGVLDVSVGFARRHPFPAADPVFDSVRVVPR